MQGEPRNKYMQVSATAKDNSLQIHDKHIMLKAYSCDKAKIMKSKKLLL